MEITFDHVIYILGILLGVGLTLIGVIFTEYIKNRNQQKKLINALYQETLNNIMLCNANLDLVENIGVQDFFPFNTIGFERFKLGILLDEKKNKEFLENLYRAYAVIQWFNSKIFEFENKRRSETGQLFNNVKKYLEIIRPELFAKTKSNNW